MLQRNIVNYNATYIATKHLIMLKTGLYIEIISTEVSSDAEFLDKKPPIHNKCTEITIIAKQITAIVLKSLPRLKKVTIFCQLFPLSIIKCCRNGFFELL